MKNITFGEALEAVKEGKLIAREGWNGKGMFVFQRPSAELDRTVVIDMVQSLPESLKTYYRRQRAVDFEQPVICNIRFNEYLCMKSADESIVNGWLASQTDMLAEDWQVLDY